MRINDKVICIKEVNGFTLYKTYIITELYAYGAVLNIIDDDGFLDTIGHEYFMTLSKYRDLKINNILDEV
jgi:hypothetical protein